jgi:hypothetical protein
MDNLEDDWLEWLTTLSGEEFERLMAFWESDDCKDVEDELRRLEDE